jgi:hypothetical protein
MWAHQAHSIDWQVAHSRSLGEPRVGCHSGTLRTHGAAANVWHSGDIQRIIEWDLKKKKEKKALESGVSPEQALHFFTSLHDTTLLPYRGPIDRPLRRSSLHSTQTLLSGSSTVRCAVHADNSTTMVPCGTYYTAPSLLGC